MSLNPFSDVKHNLSLLRIFIIAFHLCLQTFAMKGSGESPMVNVTAVMEGEARLPCNITAATEDDQPVLIMFYRNNTGTPIYTVDLRSQDKSVVKHLPSHELKTRAKFKLRANKSGLLFENIWSSDDGLYRCRVDFKKSPTKNSRIRLIVIVPPDSVRIEDQSGSEKSSTIGPYVLGQTLELTCYAKGGRPAPRLTWYADHEPITGVTRIKEGEVANALKIPSLQRHHLHQSYICQASNDKQVVPVTGAVTIDMTLPPLSVRIKGLENSVSAGIGVTATCEVVGARPIPVITWWLDDRPLHILEEKPVESGNVTESRILLHLTKDDQGRRLKCTAETPGLLQSAVDAEVPLKVHYVPVVRITSNPNVDLNNIREGDDVRLTCSIHAEPHLTSVSWYHNNGILTRNASVGVVVSNVSLVIQKATRYSSGNYVCRARNAEGEGSSRPVTLKIKFAPVCAPKQRLVYGVARGELVRILCKVDAHPRDIHFDWFFNSSLEERRMDDTHIRNNWTESKLTYTPTTRRDYGQLYCTGSNSVGRQKDPCMYTIFPAGPPDRLRNCSVINVSLDSVEVHCAAGFDGGLPQNFIMEVFETRGRKLKSNVTSKSASFTVRGLPSGLHLTIRLYSANNKGRSPVTELSAATLHPLKKISGVVPTELPSTMELSPSLTIILGVIGGILVVFIIIVVVMVVRRPKRDQHRNGMQQDDSSVHILKKEDSHSGRMEGDEKDPDVIPETRGARLDNERNISSVPTIYGDIVNKNHPNNNRSINRDSANNAHAHVHHDTAKNIQQIQDSVNVNAHRSIEAHPTNVPVVSSTQICPPNEFKTNPGATMTLYRHPNMQRLMNSHPQPASLPSQFTTNTMVTSAEHQLNPYKHQATVATPTHPSIIPPSYTQTLPHPRSFQGRGTQAVAPHNQVKQSRHPPPLVRRGSLYMDPYSQPLAPPPPYNSLDKPDMGAIVPIASETVRITPNPPCGMGVNGVIISPPDPFPPKPFPTSFAATEQDKDRMESSV